MPVATIDNFINHDEFAEQLGIAGATLEASTRTYLDGIRETAVHDFEKVMELFLVGKQRSYFGRITPGGTAAFSVIFTDHIESVASLSYRTATDSALARSGTININNITFESLAPVYGTRRFLAIKPAGTWPADCHESGDALVNLNTGIDASLVPLMLPPTHKQYLLLQASGYYDSRIVSPGDKSAGVSPLDHDLARRMARGFAPGPTPHWERMMAAQQQAATRH